MKKIIFVASLVVNSCEFSHSQEYSQRQIERLKLAIVYDSPQEIAHELTSISDINKIHFQTRWGECTIGNVDALQLLWYNKRTQMLEVVKLLCEKGINITDTIMCMYVNSNKDVFEYLIAKGGNVNAKNVLCKNKSALHMAIFHNRADIVNELLKANASVTIVDEDGVTPLHATCQHDRLNMIELLIKNDAEIDALDRFGKSIFHHAFDFTYSTKQIIQLLILHSPLWLINHTDNNGNTALHKAVSFTKPHGVSFLLASPAIDINVKNNDDETPFALAKKLDNKIAGRLLVRYSLIKKLLSSKTIEQVMIPKELAAMIAYHDSINLSETLIEEKKDTKTKANRI